MTDDHLQKLFGKKLAKFQIVLHCMWQNGKIETFIEEAPEAAEASGDDDGLQMIVGVCRR